MVCLASSSRSSRSAELERLVGKLQRCVGLNPFAQEDVVLFFEIEEERVEMPIRSG
jgi:hypothetical protein